MTELESKIYLYDFQLESREIKLLRFNNILEVKNTDILKKLQYPY